MYDIKLLNKISPVINGVFDEKYTLGEDIDNPDGIIVRSYNMAEYEVGERLVAVGRAGAGVNNIPLDKMTEKGIAVFNTPGANANAVKELVLAGMLLASRDVIGGVKWINTVNSDVAKTAEKGKGKFAGREIFGKTVGVIGLGAIGVLVANACVALGMTVCGYDPYLSEKAKNTLDSTVTVTDLDTIFTTADIITVHVPLLDSTKHLVNKSAIEKFKGNVILLNMARGALVDVEAVKAGLSEGKISKYVVDFPDETVLNTDGIIAIPHLGASTEEAEDNCAVMASEQIIDYIENGNVVNSVNFPSLKKPRTGSTRTCVLVKAEDSGIFDGYSDKALATRFGLTYAIIDEPTEDFPTAIKVRKI